MTPPCVSFPELFDRVTFTRDKPEEVVLKLRRVEVLQGQGMAIADAVRQIGVTEPTWHRWRNQCDGKQFTFANEIRMTVQNLCKQGGT